MCHEHGRRSSGGRTHAHWGVQERREGEPRREDRSSPSHTKELASQSTFCLLQAPFRPSPGGQTMGLLSCLLFLPNSQMLSLPPHLLPLPTILAGSGQLSLAVSNNCRGPVGSLGPRCPPLLGLAVGPSQWKGWMWLAVFQERALGAGERGSTGQREGSRAPLRRGGAGLRPMDADPGLMSGKGLSWQMPHLAHWSWGPRDPQPGCSRPASCPTGTAAVTLHRPAAPVGRLRWLVFKHLLCFPDS